MTYPRPEFDRSRTFVVAPHREPLICGDRMFYPGDVFDKTVVTTRRLRQLYDNRSLAITDDPPDPPEEKEKVVCDHSAIVEAEDGTATCGNCGIVLQDYKPTENSPAADLIERLTPPQVVVPTEAPERAPIVRETYRTNHQTHKKRGRR